MPTCGPLAGSTRPGLHGHISAAAAPRHLDENAMLALIDPDKDADGLHPLNLDASSSTSRTAACTPRGIVELLRRYDAAGRG